MIMLLHSPSIQIYRGATVLQLYVISFLTLPLTSGSGKNQNGEKKYVYLIFYLYSFRELKNSEVQLNNINYEMTICLIK